MPSCPLGGAGGCPPRRETGVTSAPDWLAALGGGFLHPTVSPTHGTPPPRPQPCHPHTGLPPCVLHPPLPPSPRASSEPPSPHRVPSPAACPLPAGRLPQAADQVRRGREHHRPAAPGRQGGYWGGGKPCSAPPSPGLFRASSSPGPTLPPPRELRLSKPSPGRGGEGVRLLQSQCPPSAGSPPLCRNSPEMAGVAAGHVTDMAGERGGSVSPCHLLPCTAAWVGKLRQGRCPAVPPAFPSGCLPSPWGRALRVGSARVGVQGGRPQSPLAAPR